MLTEVPGRKLSLEKMKFLAKRLMASGRGPDGVVASVCRGWKESGVPLVLNPEASEIIETDVVWVNRSIEALRWAINKKKEGHIRQLMAGPNLVVGPLDYSRILLAPEIDKILQPSNWVRDFYLSLSPKLIGKIKVWPAGVEIPVNVTAKKQDLILVYFKKSSDKKLLGLILGELEDRGVSYQILHYGNYKKMEYFDLLEKSKAMIYISNSESQGLALAEAWARNVPTLVWDRGFFEYGQYSWRANNISSPYLTEDNGITFGGGDDFGKRFDSFMSNRDSFRSKEYVEANLSDKVCAEKLLAIIND